MRLLLGIVVGVSVCLLLVVRDRQRLLRASLSGWEQVCYQAPHQTLTPRVLEGLAEARVIVGAHGWQPSLEWINEQCAVLGRS